MSYDRELEEDLDRTLGVQADIIRELREKLAARDTRIEELMAEVCQLRLDVGAYKQRVRELVGEEAE